MKTKGDIDIPDNNINLLNGYKRLPVNWNGYNSEPFNEGFIDSVITLIKGLDRQPKIFPTAQNSIQFEYYYNNSDDEYLEFEVFPDKIAVYIEKAGEPTEEFEIGCTKDGINEVVSKFYGR